MKTALIVDDDAALLRLTADVLRDEGFAVVATRTADAALAHLADTSPDLVVTDLSLMRVGGGELALRLAGLSIPVLVLSGAMDIAAQARELGAPGVLQKPFELDEFVCLATRLADLPVAGQS